jgi:3-oxoadipate enol-lactonase
MERMVAETPPEGDASCCMAIERMDLRPDLVRIRAATLAIAGADDRRRHPNTSPRSSRASSARSRTEIRRLVEQTPAPSCWCSTRPRISPTSNSPRR